MNYVASALEEVCVNKTKLSREMHRIQRRPNRSRLRISASLLIASFALFPVPAHAFVAAGDRMFPGTLILPQIAPTDETYIQGATPFSGTPIPLNTRRTDVIGLFGKTLTESLGIRVRDVYTRLDPVDASSRYGWQTLTATAPYIAVLDGPHEFLFSVGVDRQFSGTGAGRVQPRGFSGVGATTPSIYFGKGLGDLDIGQSWSMSEDGLSWVFVLGDGLKFHDGEPITAEDIKFSFERYRGANQGLIKQQVATIETPDARHVRFKLNKPWPDFLTFYSSASGAGWIVPKKYVEKVGDAGFQKHPIGAGPYKFVSFTPGIELVLEAFDGYWRKSPAVKHVVMKSIPDETTRLAGLKHGEFDIAYSIRGELAEELQHTPGLSLKSTLGQATNWIYFPEQWDLCRRRRSLSM